MSAGLRTTLSSAGGIGGALIGHLAGGPGISRMASLVL